MLQSSTTRLISRLVQEHSTIHLFKIIILSPRGVNDPFSFIYITCLAGAKRGGDGVGREREGLSSLPNTPPFFPSSLSPTPFDACYAGYHLYGSRYTTRRLEPIPHTAHNSLICSDKLGSKRQFLICFYGHIEF